MEVVFRYPQDYPAVFLKGGGHSLVSAAIGLYLPNPESTSDFSQFVALRTAVPKASVDEDSEPLP